VCIKSAKTAGTQHSYTFPNIFAAHASVVLKLAYKMTLSFGSVPKMDFNLSPQRSGSNKPCDISLRAPNNIGEKGKFFKVLGFLIWAAECVLCLGRALDRPFGSGTH
jgi:hypothetical protein